MKATKLPADELALTNKVFLSPQDSQMLKKASRGNYVKVKEWILSFEENNLVAPGMMCFSSVQRRFIQLSLNEAIEVQPYYPANIENCYIHQMTIEVDLFSKNTRSVVEFKVEDISKILLTVCNEMFLTVDQKMVLDASGINVELRVKSCEVANLTAILGGDENEVTSHKATRGIVHAHTRVLYEKTPGANIKLIGDNAAGPSIFRPDWNFENMGIGGLDNEFNGIFRRAFASRVFPPNVLQKLGINHVKGILLHGPPGTGKTLMARQIGKMLNGKEPKIVNGPEILNKFVGQSEENIRNLFKEAEIEYKDKGDASELHIIIFDEIDAICKQRGSRQDSTGVHDTVVNQLLAKIDGVDALNNILVIGMTNRKDLIDEALLRPGRLEVHMEIPLPDEQGRLQIFHIHTRKMRESQSMAADVDLHDLAARSKNFSGAEIEGLVKSASSFALNRQIDTSSGGVKVKNGNFVVTRDDFEMALNEIKPAFGVDIDDFENCMRNGIIHYSPKVTQLLADGKLFIQQVQNSKRTPLVSLLLEGAPGSGKTALAAHIAQQSGYPYVKLLSPESLVGYSESGKCNKISKVFDDAYRSPISCIVVDDIERLLEYVRIGPRFSNIVLQTLLVFLKKDPPKGKKLLIIGTTSNKMVLEDMEFMKCFDSVLSVPQVSTREEFAKVLHDLGTVTDSAAMSKVAAAFSSPLSIKKLIMLSEMARQAGTGHAVVDKFAQLLVD